MTLVHDGPLLRSPFLNNPDYDDDDLPTHDHFRP